MHDQINPLRNEDEILKIEFTKGLLGERKERHQNDHKR